MYQITGGNSLLDVNLILTKADVREEMKVADLGCGTTGHFVFPAAIMVGRKGTVYAVDIMRTALEAIERRKRQENIVNIKTVWSNLETFKATKIESNSLDLVLLINTLYQSHKRPEIVREAVRMLKRNCRLVVVDWKNVSAPFGPPVDERLNKENMINSANQMGLNFEEEFFAGQFHFGLIFTKI